MSLKNKLFQKITYWSIFIAISIGICFWLIPVPESPLRLEKTETTEWQIPSSDKKSNLDAAYQTIIQQPLWGKEKTDLQTVQSDTWQLNGVVRVSGKRFALIKIGDKTERYKAGDMLPGGEVLQTVYEDLIHVRTEGEGVRIVRLYQ